MASNKFCLTQDEPRVEDNGEVEERPIDVVNPDQVSKEPDPLFHGLEWTTLDLQNENELQELYNLVGISALYVVSAMVAEYSAIVLVASGWQPTRWRLLSVCSTSDQEHPMST